MQKHRGSFSIDAARMRLKKGQANPRRRVLALWVQLGEACEERWPPRHRSVTRLEVETGLHRRKARRYLPPTWPDPETYEEPWERADAASRAHDEPITRERSRSVIDTTQLHQLDAPQLREMVRSLMGTVVAKDREIAFKQATIDKITHEMAVLKRLKFAARGEAFNAEQKSLLEETIDADLAAPQSELDKVRPDAQNKGEKKAPKREELPANLPRREIHHEPENITCSCGCALKRIGEDVAEKLDYAPGVFTVERHVRDKWVCAHCETLVQAPVAPHIIDKGLPWPGCWPRFWSPSSSITCRCTGRNASSSAPAWPSRVRPWRNGCQRRPPVAFASCCRIAGSRRSPQADPTGRRQDGFAVRIRCADHRKVELMSTNPLKRN